MRLVGDMEPISNSAVHAVKTIVKKEHLTDADIVRAFVDQATVEDPSLYACHLAHSAKLWLPIYYFMRQAGLNEDDTAKLLSEKPNSKRTHLGNVIKRVKKRSRPSSSRSLRTASTEPERGQLIAGSLPTPTTEAECERFLKATMTLQPDEIQPDHLLPMLASCLDNFSGGKNNTLIGHAIAYVDIVWHEQVAGPPPAPSSGSDPARPDKTVDAPAPAG